MLTIGPLNDLPNVRHAFFTREGGVSTGIYGSLNCGLGSGDDPAHVRENRRRAMAKIDAGEERLVTLYQVHSDTVVEVAQPWAPDEGRPRADAMVTRTPGVVLGVLTADCAPVLFADSEAGVVGAAHAGWKGALGGVIERTVEAMVALGAQPQRIVAAVGPAIAQRSYEVGPEFPAAFIERDPGSRALFAPRADDRLLFDLKGFVARRLGACGVGSVVVLPCDTYAEAGRFFSYRRSRAEGAADYGRGLSAIYLEG